MQLSKQMGRLPKAFPTGSSLFAMKTVPILERFGGAPRAERIVHVEIRPNHTIELLDQIAGGYKLRNLRIEFTGKRDEILLRGIAGNQCASFGMEWSISHLLASVS